MRRRNRSQTDRRGVLRQVLLWLWTALVISAALLYRLPDAYDLQAGDVAPQSIRAPRDITYVSARLSQQSQEDAARQVAPIYTPVDFEVAREQFDRARRVLSFLRVLRSDPVGTEEERIAWMLAVPELADLPPSVAAAMLALPEASWNRVQLEFLDLLDQLLRQEQIREDTLSEIRRWVPSRIALDLPQDEAAAVEALVVRFLRPNMFFDEAATEAAREAAREAAPRAFRTFRAGEIVVREGNVITELDMEVLIELGLTSQARDWRESAVGLLLSAMLVLFLWAYLRRLHPQTLADGKLHGLFVVLLSVFVVLAWSLMRAGDLPPYLFPGAAAGMLVATTVGVIPAVGLAIVLGAISGWISAGGYGMALMVVLGTAAAVLSLPRYEQTGSIFRSGLIGGLVQVAVVFVFSAAELNYDPVALLVRLGIALTGGLISSALTVGGLFLLAPVFDLTTTFRLIELSRPNHPLLQRMLREAPATFNHVMMVTSLAEQAAERIGANALLTRVGAYYHDIGKLVRPYFFVENQQGLSNPHDRLDPYTSVDVLTGHVRDGIKLARQYGLPERVVAFIPEHHGTMRASFFYQKAVEAAGGEPGLVDESQFRYPGPTPRSRETLLVMLADSSEAATRARRPADPKALAEVVNSVFEQRIRDGQLDACPITMAELRVVRETYIDLLRGAFHPRVQYPEPPKKSGEHETK